MEQGYGNEDYIRVGNCNDEPMKEMLIMRL
jgi:hypothetical protein